jgi:hypothetical protein
VRAYETVRNITTEIEETAEQAANEVRPKTSGSLPCPVLGWGSESLDHPLILVEAAGDSGI